MIDWAAFTPWTAAAGGALIGVAAVLLMLGAGRIAGISGILSLIHIDVYKRQALKFTREFYADTVDYFKKQRPKSEILADKEAYFARWPVRRFVVDQNSLRAKCQDQMCMVKGLYDYKVSSPERGKTATGTSNFTYVLDPVSYTHLSYIRIRYFHFSK